MNLNLNPNAFICEWQPPRAARAMQGLVVAVAVAGLLLNLVTALSLLLVWGARRIHGDRLATTLLEPGEDAAPRVRSEGVAWTLLAVCAVAWSVVTLLGASTAGRLDDLTAFLTAAVVAVVAARRAHGVRVELRWAGWLERCFEAEARPRRLSELVHGLDPRLSFRVDATGRGLIPMIVLPALAPEPREPSRWLATIVARVRERMDVEARNARAHLAELVPELHIETVRAGT